MNKRLPIATRKLTRLGSKQGVLIEVFAPEPEGDDYKCSFKITGAGFDKEWDGMGADSLQALVLALHAIGATLYTSADYRKGMLEWDRSRNLGIPVSDVIADLVPKD